MPGKIIEQYDYTDEKGGLLYQVCRTEPKGFFQRRPIPGHQGEWAYGLSCGKFGRDPESRTWYERTNNWPPGELVELPELRKVPYHLSDLVDAKRKAHPVLIAEGEGKVDLLRGLGFIATCSAGGAGKWPVRFGEYLLERRVVIFPDCDEVGWVHAHQVMASAVIFGAASVRIVSRGWEKMPDKADVKDWLADVEKNGGDRKANLIELIKAQQEWKPCQT